VTLAERASAGTHEFQPIDIADRLAIAYLALPVLLFFLGWFSPAIGGFLAVLLFAGLAPVLRSMHGAPFAPPWRITLVAIIVALAWSALGGAGHFVYANSDWPVRDAVLRDLVVSGWPPGYGTVGGVEVILRTPVAYYLPAAALGKVFGLQTADIMLFVWTAIGVALFLVIALSSARSARHISIAIAVVVFFSGMDVFGGDRYFLNRPSITQHLEWWAQLFQYSANTTQLFWVPNHALPGWIVAALIYKHWRNPDFLAIAPIVFAVTPLWSPLITIGLAPFTLFIAAHHLRQEKWRGGVKPWAWLGAVVTFGTAAYYLVLDGASIPSGWTVARVGSMHALGEVYVKFVALEFGLLALMLWFIRRDELIIVSALVLLVLPLYTFGPGNDLVMRSSIPALMILCLSAADALSKLNWSERSMQAIPVIVFLTFGAFTAVHEIARAVLVPRWTPALTRNLIEAARGTPTHYLARVNPLLGTLMRPVQPVPGLHLKLPAAPPSAHSRK